MDWDFAHGEILLLDKPKQWTSFDVVAKVRNLIRRYTGMKVKVGHSGTLDPMATGLLVLATGRKTKQLGALQGLDKEYIAEIKFGATTPSYDAETEEIEHFPVEHLTEQLIEDALTSFLGKQLQTPPAYSAKKINGKKAYQLTRQGEEVQLKPNEVEFKQIQILSLNLPRFLIVRLTVSKGTYIRSFAHDLGQRLRTGAYLTNLRRTKIGTYSVDEAMTIAEFEKKLKTILPITKKDEQ